MAAVLAAQSQSGGTNPAAGVGAATDWPMYRHDQAGTGYSPLTQIDAQERRQPDTGLDLQPAAHRCPHPPAGEAVRPR